MPEMIANTDIVLMRRAKNASPIRKGDSFDFTDEEVKWLGKRVSPAPVPEAAKVEPGIAEAVSVAKEPANLAALEHPARVAPVTAAEEARAKLRPASTDV